MSRGLEQAGLDVRAGVDVDGECRFPYESNTGGEFVEADVGGMSWRRLEDLFGDAEARVLVGCAPCQPFSTKNAVQDGEEREDWGLLREVGRLAQRLRPEVVAVENVTRIRQHEVYSWFVDVLQKAGYRLSVNEVHSEEYGVPQTRERVVIVASRLGTPELVPPTHTDEDVRTVRDAIGDLSPLGAGEVHPDDPLHRASALSDENLERLDRMPEGGDIFDLTDQQVRPERFQDTLPVPGEEGYLRACSRMSWDEPAPAISTEFHCYGTGPYGHPDESQNRALSLREGARLQDFPDEYVFVSPDTEPRFGRVARLIGNAVPPSLAEAVGRSIQTHVEEHDVPTAT